MASFKESIRQALKNIIQKQAKLGLGSRFVFGKILKSVNETTVIDSWEDLKRLKFVGEKTLERIKKEASEMRKASSCCRSMADVLDKSISVKEIKVSDGLYNQSIDNSQTDRGSVENINEANTSFNSGLRSGNTPKSELPDSDSYVRYLRGVCEKYETSNVDGNNGCSSCTCISENVLLDDAVDGQAGLQGKTKDAFDDATANDTSMDNSDASSGLIILKENDPKKSQNQKTTENANSDMEKIFDSFSDLNLDDFRVEKSNTSFVDNSFLNSSDIASSFDLSITNSATVANIAGNASILNNARSVGSNTRFLDTPGFQRKRKYVPGYRTAAYAILRALYHYNGSHKHLIVLRATPHTDAEFDKSQRFSAFSSFKTLQKKGLLQIDSDSRCHLTRAGSELCAAMFANDSFSTIEEQNIQVVIDCREKKNNRDRAFFQGYFSSKGIPNQTRYLNVGDFVWLKNERVIDVIVERKQTSDLVSSISDGRFREQKNRLKNLGFTVFYLIENMKVEESRKSYANRCLLEVRMHGFILLETESIQETALVLENIDRTVRNNENQTPVSYGSFLNEGNKNNIKVRDMLLVCLLSVRGMSRSSAIALCDKYQTLSNFREQIKNPEFKNILANFKTNNRAIGDKIASRIIVLFS